MLKVLGRLGSLNVRKVLFLLEELGLPYDRLDYGRGFAATDTPEYLSLNPNGLIPVLIDGHNVVWESNTILRYIAAKYARENWYPRDTLARSGVDRWLDWSLAHLSAPMRLLFFRLFLKTGDYSDREVAEAERECEKYFTILNKELERKEAFVTGSEITIADCAIGSACHRWINLPLRHPDLPALDLYYKKLCERSAFQKTLLIGMP
jgi:glutathione S-transferase